MMIKYLVRVGSAAALGMILPLTSSPARAMTLDGVFVLERVFNGYPNSTLSVTNDYPTQVQFEESAFGEQVGAFANRHDALFSDDGGTNPRTFDIGESFAVQANVTLEDGSNTPRKEAGIRINSPITGDVLFIVNSDAGEIVAFGGGGPFYIFGKNATGDGYTPGQTIFMRMIYQPNSNTLEDPGTLEYIINRGNGVETSGPLGFDNLEKGPVDFEVGLYAQATPNDPVADFSIVTYTNIAGNDGNATLGDVNLDGAVNGLDVNPFVERVISGPYQVEADLNEDGSVDGLDVNPFVDVVVSGGAGMAAEARIVPEPATAALAGVGMVVLVGCLFTQSGKPG
ncbi:MAG: hypothetical protein A2W31_04780 [Planctomycetes bacterium RBG_16_64_10]|nr:MAG: hypothetical protein A2W31_04780 [Planctomycetes bacterium RBG_16_64_10]